ncbi:MAG: hypothetical protein V3U98_03925 [Acidobacteriota bacterium]
MSRLSVLLVGCGNVGSAFAGQLMGTAKRLAEQGLDIRLVAVAARKALALEQDGLEAANWKDRLQPCAGDTARQALEALATVRPLVLVDGTADPALGALYLGALERSVHVVSCNKMPFAGPQRQFDELMVAARRAGAYLRYEATVGAGLPTLRSLRDLHQSGDIIEQIRGCFSGTLNLLCVGLNAGQRFSELLVSARAKGYTEPDPREDLSGRDVARKALILARLAGGHLEPEQVRCTPFVRTDGLLSVERFMSELDPLDREIGERARSAARAGKVLRYVAHATPAEAGCGLMEVDGEDPLAQLAGPENVFVYHTQRYSVPLVIGGPGAGPEVAASGLFADVLEVARSTATEARR